MDVPDGDGEIRMWMVIHPEAVARIIEESLRDDAWWIAARTGRYVQGPTVWADCVRPAPPALARPLSESDVEPLLRTRGNDG